MNDQPDTPEPPPLTDEHPPADKEAKMSTTLPRPERVGQGTVVEMSRAVAEVQAAVLTARTYPRDEQKAITNMRQSCRMPAVAERAFWRFQRGGQNVNGNTIHLARELARCWGNIDYGVKELSRDDVYGQSEMLAFAWDLETNARSETVFIVPHMRDKRGGPQRLSDMRDIYENNANNGARRLRECIFSVLPPWYKEMATDECHKTLKEGGGVPLPKRIARSIEGFAQKFNITAEQLEKKLERKQANWTDEDVAQLGIIFKSLRANETTIEEEFGGTGQTVTADDIKKQAKAKKKADDDQNGEPDLDESPAAWTAWATAKFDKWQTEADVDAFNESIADKRARLYDIDLDLFNQIDQAFGDALERVKKGG